MVAQLDCERLEIVILIQGLSEVNPSEFAPGREHSHTGWHPSLPRSFSRARKGGVCIGTRQSNLTESTPAPAKSEGVSLGTLT